VDNADVTKPEDEAINPEVEEGNENEDEGEEREKRDDEEDRKESPVKEGRDGREGKEGKKLFAQKSNDEKWLEGMEMRLKPLLEEVDVAEYGGRDIEECVCFVKSRSED